MPSGEYQTGTACNQLLNQIQGNYGGVGTYYTTTTTTTLTQGVFTVYQGWYQQYQYYQQGLDVHPQVYGVPLDATAGDILKDARKHAEDATQKAEEMLKRFLDKQQQEDYDREACFFVHTKKGVYRIRKGWAGNIDFGKEKDQWESRLCVHPRDFIPEPEVMLTQKLMLETNEELLLRTANHTRIM